MWYGLHVGLSYSDVTDMIFGELLDLIAVDQIKEEGFIRVPQKGSEEEEFYKILALE